MTRGVGREKGISSTNLHVPMVGLVFCLAYLLDRRPKFKPTIFVILILFSLRIVARNVEWGDPVKFYENELRYTQNSINVLRKLEVE